MGKMSRGGRGAYDGYDVNPEALHNHAQRLEAFKDRFTALTEASLSVTKTEGAFGLMFADWLDPLMDAKHMQVHPLIGEAESALETHIQALRDCADSYAAADEAVAGDLDVLESEMP